MVSHDDAVKNQPQEGTFYYSKPKAFTNLALSVIVVIGAFCFSWFLSKSEYVSLPILLLTCAVAVIVSAINIAVFYNTLKDNTPQLKITERGIWSEEDGFCGWDEISDVYVQSLQSASSAVNLIIEKGGNVESILPIQDLKDYNTIDLLILKYKKHQSGQSNQFRVKKSKFESFELVKLLLIAVGVAGVLWATLYFYLFQA